MKYRVLKFHISNLSVHTLGLDFTPGHWTRLWVILLLCPCVDCIEAKEGIVPHRYLEAARLCTLLERYAEALDLCQLELAKFSKRSDFVSYFTTQSAITEILYRKGDRSEAVKLLKSVLLEQPPPKYEHEFKSLLARYSDDANISLDDDQLYGHWFLPAPYRKGHFCFVPRGPLWKDMRQLTASELLGMSPSRHL
jgi:hypothetical protein